MRNLAFLTLTVLILAFSAACAEDTPPSTVTGEFVTYLNNAAQTPHKYTDVELESLNGNCQYDEATGKFSIKFSDGPWTSPNTTYYLEAIEVTGNTPKSLRVREGEFNYEPKMGTDFKCNETGNDQLFKMEYVEDEVTGETYYMLKFNCAGEVNASDSSAIDPMRLTNLKSTGTGIKITECDGF